MDAVDTLYANTRNNPIEEVRTHAVRVLRTSCGKTAAGPASGAAGWARCERFAFSTTAVPRSKARVTNSVLGVSWADATAPRLNWCCVERPARNPAALEGAAHAGILWRRVRLRWSLRGRYGDPLERDPEAVRQDVIDGIVSPKSAGRE